MSSKTECEKIMKTENFMFDLISCELITNHPENGDTVVSQVQVNIQNRTDSTMYSAVFSCSETFPFVSNNDELVHFIREHFDDFKLTEDQKFQFTTKIYKKTFTLESPLQTLHENVSTDVLSQRIAQLTAQVKQLEASLTTRIQQWEACGTFYFGFDGGDRYLAPVFPVNIKRLNIVFMENNLIKVNGVQCQEINLEALSHLPFLEELNFDATPPYLYSKKISSLLEGFIGDASVLDAEIERRPISSLRRISINGYFFKNLHYSGLTAFRNLEEITIQRSPNLVDVSQSLCSFTRLRKLSVQLAGDGNAAAEKNKIETACKERNIQVTIITGPCPPSREKINMVKRDLPCVQPTSSAISSSPVGFYSWRRS